MDMGAVATCFYDVIPLYPPFIFLLKIIHRKIHFQATKCLRDFFSLGTCLKYAYFLDAFQPQYAYLYIAFMLIEKKEGIVIYAVSFNLLNVIWDHYLGLFFWGFFMYLKNNEYRKYCCLLKKSFLIIPKNWNNVIESMTFIRCCWNDVMWLEWSICKSLIQSSK